jgi:conjugal transfer pilus assembly protein TraF
MYLPMVLMALLMTAVPAQAQPSEPSTVEPKKRGIYWYEKPPQPVPDSSNKEPQSQHQQPQYSRPAVPDIDTMMAWHPEQIRELFKQAHEFHVMAPTLETAGDIQRLKAVMNKKARAAAAVEQLALLTNPAISGVSENAINPSVRSLQRKQRDRTIGQRLLKERQQFALIFLTQPGCETCIFQRNVMAAFAERYGWRIKEVDIQANPMAKARFSVQVTPTTLIIGKQSQEWLPVSIGSDSLISLTRNVYQGIRLLSAEINPSQWLTAPTQTDSLYDPGPRK